MAGSAFNKWFPIEKVVPPLAVNVLTAVTLFLCALLFKESIMNFFRGEPPVPNYPLYCIAEPETNDHGTVDVELFVINLTDEKQTHAELETFLEIYRTDEHRSAMRPDIRLLWDHPFQKNKITRIVPAIEFNRNKGDIWATLGEVSFLFNRVKVSPLYVGVLFLPNYNILYSNQTSCVVGLRRKIIRPHIQKNIAFINKSINIL